MRGSNFVSLNAARKLQWACVGVCGRVVCRYDATAPGRGATAIFTGRRHKRGPFVDVLKHIDGDLRDMQCCGFNRLRAVSIDSGPSSGDSPKPRPSSFHSVSFLPVYLIVWQANNVSRFCYRISEPCKWAVTDMVSVK